MERFENILYHHSKTDEHLMKKLIVFMLFSFFSLGAMKRDVSSTESTVDCDIIDVSKMIEEINQSVAAQDAAESLKVLTRLTLFCQLDWKWLTVQQKEKFFERIVMDLEGKVNAIQPKRLSMLQSMELNKPHYAWLRNKIQQGQCCGIEWRELLAPTSNDNTSLPSPEILKEERLKVLSTLGTVQQMQ